ncbi:putative DNA-binding protein [Klebsiella pneumoniae IS43]|uniref:DNA-binding protein n=1 Tax=Klebsiella pneumoniae IS43 TaxID=1432552 RepID=W1DWF0_KLEPN|nr:putative DNA-binding protein [Klebsiella pneumoniae IS43]
MKRCGISATRCAAWKTRLKHFNHPQLGRFSLQQMYWYSAPRNGSRLLVYLPMDEAGEQALAWLDQH